MRRPKLSRLISAAILIVFVLSGATPAMAQTGCFPMSCNDPNMSGPASQGDSIGDDDDGNGAGGPPGQAGSPGADSAAGQDAPAQPGTSQAGQPGASGRIVPPPPPPSRTTTTTRRPSTSTSRTSNSAATGPVGTPTPDPLLSPTPSPSPSPSPTPSESPSPTPSPSDLVAALDDADPAASDGSLVPFFAMVAGAILLFLYVRSRRPRRGLHSTGHRRGGGHSF